MQIHGMMSRRSDGNAPVVSDGTAESNSTVHVCIDTVEGARRLIAPAKVLARALAADVSFIHVIQMHDANGRVPFDPVEWDIKRREAEAKISGLARDTADPGASISVHVLEGRCAEQICKMLSGRSQDIAVLCRSHCAPASRMGETVRRMVENGTGSLLVIPDTYSEAKTSGIARIVLLLDGSGQSESAIPFALRIAESEDAEIILVHATPEPALTQAGPPEPRDDELMDEIRQRNMRIAQKYLSRQAAHLRGKGVKTKTVLTSGGDVRRQVMAAVAAQAADLVVLASHGQSGFADTALGDVATYIVSRSATPVFLVRHRGEEAAEHVFSAAISKGVRGPGLSRQ